MKIIVYCREYTGVHLEHSEHDGQIDTVLYLLTAICLYRTDE